jgi:hypothetical protein
MSAVQARIHYSMKQEFKLLAAIIRDYAPVEYDYDPETGNKMARQADFDMVEVIPVSDPNAATMSQKVVQYQAVMQMAQSAPQIYDLAELNKQMLEVLGIKNIGKLIPSADDHKPKDPVTENMAVLTGKPVKAFIYQDHEAHISVHMAAMQDPKLGAMVGQSPMAQQIGAAMQAHIAEHLAFEYRKQVEDQLGSPLPSPEDELSKEAELTISRLVADAATKLLQKDQAEAQQQQAQQQAQDPLVQMQQQELQLKAQEIEIKKAKILADIEIDKAKLQIEMERIQSQERQSGAQMGMKAQESKAKLAAQQEMEGVRMGIDMAKSKSQQAQQERQQQRQQPTKEQ